jgi:hypothetical protein
MNQAPTMDFDFLNTLYVWHGMRETQFRPLVEATKKMKERRCLRLDCLQSSEVSAFGRAIIQLLSSLDRDWTTLIINYRPDPSFNELIKRILSLQSFHSLYLKSSPGQSIPSSVCFKLVSPRLQKLTFCDVRFTQEQAIILDQGLRATTNAAQLHTLEFITSSFETHAFSKMMDAVRSIKTLKTLKVWYNDLSPELQIVLFNSLIGHSSLSRFDWMERCLEVSTEQHLEQLYDTFDAILSSDACRISFLGLSCGQLRLVGALLRRRTYNKSVKWLGLSYNGSGSTRIPILSLKTSISSRAFATWIFPARSFQRMPFRD